jgi:hypothetical protein
MNDPNDATVPKGDLVTEKLDGSVGSLVGTVVGYARKWHIDGEIPAKERNDNGRMVWPRRFRFLPLTDARMLPDDVPVCAAIAIDSLHADIGRLLAERAEKAERALASSESIRHAEKTILIQEIEAHTATKAELALIKAEFDALKAKVK